MKKRTLLMLFLVAFLTICLSLFAGGKQEEPKTEVQTKTGTEQELPTKLVFPMIYFNAYESPWNSSMEQALKVIQAEKPHGLEIVAETVEQVKFNDIERILREFAVTGKYEIIWAHSTYIDAVERLNEEFPDIMWIVSGGGNRYVADNIYWLDMYYHEPAFLCGVIAGMMTESDVVGAVAGYPYPNVNVSVNGFFEGAKSVNPDVKVRISYIESWFDPPRAKEAALAQISAGADFIYAERYGVFEAAQEKGILSFGHALDQHSMAPEVVVTSSVAKWEPYLRYIIDEWWNWKKTGVKYKAPKDQPIYLLLDNGGPDIAPYHGFEDKLPQEVKDAVSEAKEKIISGELSVPVMEGPPESR